MNIRNLFPFLVGCGLIFTFLYAFATVSHQNDEKLDHLSHIVSSLQNDIASQQQKVATLVNSVKSTAEDNKKLGDLLKVRDTNGETVDLVEITEKIEVMYSQFERLANSIDGLSKSGNAITPATAATTTTTTATTTRPWQVNSRSTPAFTQALERFVENHNKIINKADGVRRRFVMAEVGWAGITNRLQAIVSTFLFAMLTDRAFVLDWRVTRGQFSANVNNEGPTNTFEVDSLFKKPFDWDSKHFPANAKSYSFDPGSESLQKFMCGDLDENFEDENVKFSSWDYFGIFMTHNPKYQAKITEWFGSPDNIYEPIARFLFVPIDELQQKIDNFVKENFREYTVGLHLRTKGNMGYVMEKEHVEAAFQCAGVAFGDGVNPAGQAAVLREVDSSKIAIFLATDASETAEKAKQKFGDRVISLDGQITRATVEGIQRGIMDMWILARCDDLVVSYQSSYSRSAAALGRVLPLVVSHDGRCMRDVSNELCSCAWVNVGKLPCYNSKLHDTPYSVNQVGCSTCDGMSRWQNHANH